MKNFLLPLFLFLMLIDTIVPQAVAPVQGDVLINTFDPKINSKREEVIVLVNRTNHTIDLINYELQSFGKAGENEKYGFYQFTSADSMPAYSFLMISSLLSVNGTSRDRAWVELDTVDWTDDGYLALRKINPADQNDYIDIVKHVKSGAAFTGVPLNSGLTTSSMDFMLPVASTGTRGGLSGNFSSLVYNGYFDYDTDFSTHDSTIVIQNSSSSTLPVELSSFSAVVSKTGVKLNWRTETEVNNYGFEVERKAGSPQSSVGNWVNIGFVNGSGNSNSPKSYNFEDRNLTAGKYSYRLKQIDNDGKYEYSKAIEVNLNGPGKFELSQNYPNPFNPTTTIRFSIPEAGNVKLTLYNILAQEIKVLVNESKEAGVHTVNFNALDLNSGLYIYNLEANGLTQTRKMTLVK
jgi:hypothetical protein